MGHRISKYQQRTPAAIATSSVQTSTAAEATGHVAGATTSLETNPVKRSTDASSLRGHPVKPACETSTPTSTIEKPHLSTSSVRTAALVHQHQFESLTSTGNSVVITIRMLKMESNELNNLVQQQQQQRQQHDNCITESSIVNLKCGNNNNNSNNNRNTNGSGSIDNNYNNQSNLNNNSRVMDNTCSSDVTSASNTTEFNKCEESVARFGLVATESELLNNFCNNNNDRNPNENATKSNENNKLVTSTTSVSNSNNNIMAVVTSLDNDVAIVDNNDLRIVEDEIALHLPSKQPQQHNFICDSSINDKQDSASRSLDWSVQSTSSIAMINAMTTKLNQMNITATTGATLIDGIPAEIINSVSPYPHHIPIGSIHHHDCTVECKCSPSHNQAQLVVCLLVVFFSSFFSISVYIYLIFFRTRNSHLFLLLFSYRILH